MKKSGLLLVWLVGAVLLAPASVRAAIWMEVGDAGQLPSTAQTPMGMGSLDAIVGQLPTDADFFNPQLPPDIDMFRINIVDPANFSASTANFPLTEFIDTQLYLFRDDGTGLVANGDSDFFSFQSTIPVGSVTDAGDYFLAIALFESRPVNSSLAFLFPDLVGNTAVETPTLVDPVAAWSTLPISEPFLNYQIDLTGVELVDQAPTVVPEPSGLLVWGALLFLAGFVSLGKRRLLPFWPSG